MKLVDILARELDCWPFKHPHALLTQSASGMVEYLINNKPVVQCGAFDMADDWKSAIVSLDDWMDAVEALKAADNSAPAWSGEGLPPIGTQVVVHDDGSLVYGQGEAGEVLAHVDGTAVIRMSYGLGCFTPDCLRTPEQIAQEEREAELNRMVATVSMLDKGWARKVCAGLYDAGYRHQVTP